MIGKIFHETKLSLLFVFSTFRQNTRGASL